MFEDDEQFFEWTGKRPNGRIEPTGAYTAGRRIRRLATLEPSCRMPTDAVSYARWVLLELAVGVEGASSYHSGADAC
jgi:hypothetical protein